MENVPDHPIIRAIEKNGEPKPPKVAHQCSVCDGPIYEGESAFFIRDYGWMCEHCADMAYTVAD